MHRRKSLLCLILSLSAASASGDIVVPEPGDQPLNSGLLQALQSAPHAGSRVDTSDDSHLNRTSNFEPDAQAAQLILDYQAVAIGHAVDGRHDVVPLTVLTGDLRHDQTPGSVATTFFAPSTHLWSASAPQKGASTSDAALLLSTPPLNLGLDPLRDLDRFELNPAQSRLPNDTNVLMSGLTFVP